VAYDPFEIPEGEKCARCQQHSATVVFSSEGGALAVAHGDFAYWCGCCLVKEQIRHCEEAAARLAGLRAELRGACAGETAPDPDDLIRENAALRGQLERQWLMAHYESCGKRYPQGGHAMNHASPHAEGEHCYWPRPESLRVAR